MPLHKTLTAALLLLVACVNPGFGAPAARLAVSPDRYEVEFDSAGGATESLMVKNLANIPLTIRVSVSNWELDANNIVREIPPQENSLDQWMVINPLQVTIPPDTPQTFRWAIMPRQQPEPGEYRAIIFVEEVLAERAPTKGTSVRMKLRYGIPVYAQFGEALQAATIGRIETDTHSNSIVLDLANSGNQHARLRGQYGIWTKTDFPGTQEALELMSRPDDEELSITKLSEVVLLPGNERTVTVEPELPGPGEYVLQFDASFGDTTLIKTINLRLKD